MVPDNFKEKDLFYYNKSESRTQWDNERRGFKGKRGQGRSESSNRLVCYKCQGIGHFARDCPSREYADGRSRNISGRGGDRGRGDNGRGRNSNRGRGGYSRDQSVQFVEGSEEETTTGNEGILAVTVMQQGVH